MRTIHFGCGVRYGVGSNDLDALDPSIAPTPNFRIVRLGLGVTAVCWRGPDKPAPPKCNFAQVKFGAHFCEANGVRIREYPLTMDTIIAGMGDVA